MFISEFLWKNDGNYRPLVAIDETVKNYWTSKIRSLTNRDCS